MYSEKSLAKIYLSLDYPNFIVNDLCESSHVSIVLHKLIINITPRFFNRKLLKNTSSIGLTEFMIQKYIGVSSSRIPLNKHIHTIFHFSICLFGSICIKPITKNKGLFIKILSGFMIGLAANRIYCGIINKILNSRFSKPSLPHKAQEKILLLCWKESLKFDNELENESSEYSDTKLNIDLTFDNFPSLCQLYCFFALKDETIEMRKNLIKSTEYQSMIKEENNIVKNSLGKYFYSSILDVILSYHEYILERKKFVSRLIKMI